MNGNQTIIITEQHQVKPGQNLPDNLDVNSAILIRADFEPLGFRSDLTGCFEIWYYLDLRSGKRTLKSIQGYHDSTKIETLKLAAYWLFMKGFDHFTTEYITE